MITMSKLAKQPNSEAASHRFCVDSGRKTLYCGSDFAAAKAVFETAAKRKITAHEMEIMDRDANLYHTSIEG